MNRRQHWTGSAKGSFFQLFTLLKDKIASWARICAAYDSATSEFKLAVSDNFPLNVIIWSHSCQHGEAALHTLPMFLFTETIPPEGSPLFNFTQCSPFVSFSKYGSILNTHQTSEKKSEFHVLGLDVCLCALQKTLHHCRSERSTHEGGKTVRSRRWYRPEGSCSLDQSFIWRTPLLLLLLEEFNI